MPTKAVTSKKTSANLLPLPLTYEPMEMRPVSEIPLGANWLYEPKWDGFRCIAFCTDGDVELRSKKGESLSRYFPEVVLALEKLPSKDFVLDGELMVWHGTTPVFDDLLARIHPAESRVKKLSVETPAIYMVFDLLMAAESKNKPILFVDQPLSKRRVRLEKFASANFKKSDCLILSPASNNIEQARDWFAGKGLELDGIIAKKLDLAYQSGNRNGAVKVKRAKTADCIIGGFRYNEGTKHIGSLLLGLYDDKGELHHVGFTSAFSAAEKVALTKKLEPFTAKQSFTVNIPGGPSRWNRGKESPWVALKPKFVVEVKFDHFTGGRFRHGTKILRWREDKRPNQCTFDQL